MLEYVFHDWRVGRQKNHDGKYSYQLALSVWKGVENGRVE